MDTSVAVGHVVETRYVYHSVHQAWKLVHHASGVNVDQVTRVSEDGVVKRQTYLHPAHLFLLVQLVAESWILRVNQGIDVSVGNVVAH